jgi:hypothetical protein
LDHVFGEESITKPLNHQNHRQSRPQFIHAAIPRKQSFLVTIQIAQKPTIR